MVGQEHVLKALSNALDQGRMHHAYLFTGTRGVGKTTVARIFAKCLNCAEGVSSRPCEQCASCREINEGRFIDLIEVDAASRTKVEDTRELLENVQYRPTSGRYKVYLIDEVHMLSTHSFNALLKTLEEPPPHVIFLLATTDPQKLPATILSRCLQFNLKNMSPEKVVEHLGHVLAEEKVEFEPEALWLLGRAADGSMRDALSLTDQAIAHGNGSLSEALVREMLGSIDRSWIYRILDSLIARDAAALLEQVAAMAEHAPDYCSALDELLLVLHSVAIQQAAPGVLDKNSMDLERLVAIASAISAEDVQLFYQMALLAKRDLLLAADGRSGFEMALLRMLSFQWQPGLGPPPEPGDRSPNSVQNTTREPERRAEEVAVSCAETSGESRSGMQPRSSRSSAIRMQLAADPGNAAEAAVQPKGRLSLVEQQAALPKHKREVAQGTDDRGDARADKNAGAAKAEVLAFHATDKPRPDSERKDPPPADEVPLRDSAAGEPCEPQAAPHNTNFPPQPTEAAAGDQPIALAELTPGGWLTLFEQLDIDGAARNIASHSILERVEGSKLYFMLDEAQSALFNDSQRQKLQSSLEAYFATGVTVEVEVGSFTQESPARYKARCLSERQQHAEQVIADDPFVLLLQQQFDARLVPGSVRPADPADEDDHAS